MPISTRFKAVVGAVALLVGPGLTPPAAGASATTFPFAFHGTEVFNDAPPECMPQIKAGVTTAEFDGRGRVTYTDGQFHSHWEDTFTYRTQFDDGSYLTGVAYGHHAINQTERVFTATETIHEPRTIYAADATALGRVMIHVVSHVTVNTGTGEATAALERFFFTCY